MVETSIYIIEQPEKEEIDIKDIVKSLDVDYKNLISCLIYLSLVKSLVNSRRVIKYSSFL